MNLCCHISPMNFLVNEAKFEIFPGEVLTSRQSMRRQQQQQQHTLLTFPKGAFQRQCYKNNPITIKKSYLQLKMF